MLFRACRRRLSYVEEFSFPAAPVHAEQSKAARTPEVADPSKAKQCCCEGLWISWLVLLSHMAKSWPGATQGSPYYFLATSE